MGRHYLPYIYLPFMSGFSSSKPLNGLRNKRQCLIFVELLLATPSRVRLRLALCSDLNDEGCNTGWITGVMLQFKICSRLQSCRFALKLKKLATWRRACFCCKLSSGIAALMKRLAACILTSVDLLECFSKFSDCSLLIFLLKREMRSYSTPG